MEMLQLNDLHKTFNPGTVNEKVALNGVSLQMEAGDFATIVGSNGAGKSTFLRVLSGNLEPTTGDVAIKKGARMSVLKQDHFAYDEYTVLDTVIMGNKHLYDVMKEKDALYMKPDFSDEDGIRAAELEGEFAEMDGWEAESNVSRLIQGLGLSNDILYSQMSTLTGKEKVKVLLAQALFGNPDIILLDEPTNHLDIKYQLQLMELVRGSGCTVVAAIHDLNLAAAYCHRLYALKDGVIVGEGAPKELLTPAFLREVYEVEAEVLTGRDGSLRVFFYPSRIS